jgi:hypothetical protein
MSSRFTSTDLFLLGSSYCGSTHLGALLEANLDATYAGELAHLPAYVDRYALFDSPLGCLICSADNRPCPRWTPATMAAVSGAGPPGAGEALRRSNAGSTATSLVVDGSKWPEWLRLSLRDRAIALPRTAAVVAARSPFGYVLSARGATGEPPWVVAAWWRDVYVDALRTLNLLGIPYVVIRNEDVRADPATAVGRIAGLVGSPPADGPVRPARPTHSLGGNVFVQNGYRHESTQLLERLGLTDVGSSSWEGPHADAVIEEATITASLRPANREEALGIASQVMQVPFLTEIAQLLGYSMSVEIDRFVARSDGNAAA